MDIRGPAESGGTQEPAAILVSQDDAGGTAGPQTVQPLDRTAPAQVSGRRRLVLSDRCQTRAPLSDCG